LKNRGRYVNSAEHADSEGSWAISYGDMVTLLLTFFIIFFTVDKFNLQKKNMKLDMNEKHKQEITEKHKNMSRDIASAVEAAMDPDKTVKDAVQGKVYRAGEKIIIEFTGVSFFASGNVDTTFAARRALKAFYQNYSPYMGDYNLAIHAFTDSRKVRQAEGRRYKDNLELSALRSVSVMRDLQMMGVPLSNMKLGGYGELHLSEADLENLDSEQRKPSSLMDLARTAVLVIEPKEAP
jgi:chemotaxis protein MotB